MKAEKELLSAVRAGYSYFYSQTFEMDRSVAIIKDVIETFKNGGNENLFKIRVWDFEKNPDPEEVIKMLDESETGTVVIAKNFNWFLKDEYGNMNKGFVQFLQNRAAKFTSKEYRKVLIVVSDALFDKAIPDTLKKEFLSLEFSLPDEEEIKKILDSILNAVKTDPKFKMPDEKEQAKIIGAAKGLTRSSIENAFAFSIIKDKGVFNADTVAELRAAEIAETKGLTLQKFDDKLEDLIGFEYVLEHMEDWIDDQNAKGVLFLGPAGTGKSTVCRALANHYKRTIIELEFAQLMGEGLVGQAENAQAQALKIIMANANPQAPIILFIDEIEKGLAGTSGAGNSGARDGGTTDRSNAQFLKFLSNPHPGIIPLASCNNIEALPAAYIRADRWDCAPFFIDLPNDQQRKSILDLYKRKFNLPKNATPKIDMKDWSGAEIKTWCKLAAKKIEKGKDANDADRMVVPVAKTAEKEISYLRKWAVGRTIPASKEREEKKRKRNIVI